MKLLIVFLIVFHRSMASLETRSQSRLANSRLSGAPSEFSKFAQLVSPSSVKPFAPWDRVDGPSPLPTVARISFTCVLKGFCLGASLLPSLRAEYKVRQGLILKIRESQLRMNCIISQEQIPLEQLFKHSLILWKFFCWKRWNF